MRRIAAYVLAIQSIAERLNDARKLVESLHSCSGLSEVAIVPAIYWKDKPSIVEFLTSHPEYRFTDEYLGRCRKGQLCATLSHIKVWKKFLASDHDGVLVFEDDIYIHDRERFQEILDTLAAGDDVEWLRLHLHKRFREDILNLEEEGLFVGDPSRFGFAGYYASRSGAQKLLRRFLETERNVDMIIPDMGKGGEMNCKTIKNVVIEHHPFEGEESELVDRHEKERTMEKLQKAASTIWTSPELTSDEELHGFVSRLNNVNQLHRDGYTVLKGVLSKATIEEFRGRILANRALLRNTRPTRSSLHLAGFHRFPEFEAMHTELTSNPVILSFLKAALRNENARSIGLSDITLNRSQCWHRDLLRGRFSSFLESASGFWDENGGGVYKVLCYLQDGSSLKVIKGSHLQPATLDSDTASEPGEDSPVVSIPVEQGDIVITDIRISHRGSPESAFESGAYDDDPRILISTAMGGVNRPLTRAMEIGNFHRLMDWMERNP